ncbi:UTP--glucose-1-phosphate uridylyltransferase 3, chloroplastic [Diospyros lotus]|uniref:UTP--glucose-1-phosphate uridylyltransferase 3, chloroplastic n=1 Tax=Diospyros lotus TaxID=55363 RepID=UPI00225C06C7|nr:UTP--glucose-1-phosphate uridylyltransferase 3, chloroplastic [Diospyros lotus]
MAVVPQNALLLLTNKDKTSSSSPSFVFNLHSHSSLLFHSVKPSTSLSSSSPSCCRIPRVSTAPVEYAPPAPDFDFHQEIARLRALCSRLANSRGLNDKLRVIDSDSRVQRFFGAHKNGVSRVFESLNRDKYELFLLKCVVAAGQEHVLGSVSEVIDGEFESARGSLKRALHSLVEMIEKLDVRGGGGWKKADESLKGEEEEVKTLRTLLKTLREMEHFYDCIGGIIGYQKTVLELLAEAMTHEGKMTQGINKSMGFQFMEIHPPSVLDLSKDTEYASQAAIWGVEGLPDLGEIYPLGGSADRLGLVDPETGECLPAAMLPFCGRTLLEGLIRDLQAREFLYFKLYGIQCITPVAMMTSSAKRNHERITSLCKTLQWFGRGRSQFHLFEQPLVPTVSAEDGQWLVTRKFMPLCKPSGHGAIWKLAHDKGVFEWFYEHGRKGATVRQVSNVVAATDFTLLALAGIGLHYGKKLGFASCKRNLGATEGINVLIERKNPDGMWEYGLSCIEYTEFEKLGITNSLQARFPANTNILYVDLPSAELIGSHNDETSLPGMVLNVKKKITYMDQFGFRHCVSGGRLECTMQNIADNFFSLYSSPCFKGVEEHVLDTFIVHNERRKVTSSAKKKRRHSDKSLQQTPDGAVLDIMRNAYDLLCHCGIKIPKIEDNDKYADSGPPFLIFLHPALGPLWEVTRQKFHGGSISEHSELQLEVAEFLWREVQLDGSLIVLAENILGSMNPAENGEPILQYGYRCGRCKLQNVKVRNEGIDWSSEENIYWRHQVHRLEALKIVLHGNAEFEATDVVIQGNHIFEVPNGYKMKITSGKTGLAVQLNPIEENLMNSGSWFWNYLIKGTQIVLEFMELQD